MPAWISLSSIGPDMSLCAEWSSGYLLVDAAAGEIFLFYAGFEDY